MTTDLCNNCETDEMAFSLSTNTHTGSTIGDRQTDREKVDTKFGYFCHAYLTEFTNSMQSF